MLDSDPTIIFDPTSDEIPSLTYAMVNSDRTPYLEAVVAECLRCGSTMPFVPRDAMEDTMLLGHFIPKGSIIGCLPSHAGNINNRDRMKLAPEGFVIPPDSNIRSTTSRASGNRPGIWEDDSSMDAFRPERWIDVVEGKDGSKMLYNPKKGYNVQFGGGVRGCFGKPVVVSVKSLDLTQKVPHPSSLDARTQTFHRNAEFVVLSRSCSSRRGWDGSEGRDFTSAHQSICAFEEVE
jgi:hypothetical protein